MGPEESMQIQSNLVLKMAFDECENPAEYEYAKCHVKNYAMVDKV